MKEHSQPHGRFSRRSFLKTTALSAPLVVVGCRHVPGTQSSASDFVTIHNRRFERRGRPYRFIGANCYQAAMLGDPDLPGGRERLVRELNRTGCWTRIVTHWR